MIYHIALPLNVPNVQAKEREKQNNIANEFIHFIFIRYGCLKFIIHFLLFFNLLCTRHILSRENPERE